MKKRIVAQHGFTLAEVIISVAVLAFMVTISSPALVTFLRQRDMREEQIAQFNIRDAMKTMLNEKYYLPGQNDTGNAAWYNMLSRYTNLSPYDVQYDQWKNPRVYVMQPVPLTFQGVSLTAYYATILSKGYASKAAQVVDASGTVVVPVSGNNFAALNDTHWWNVSSTHPDITAGFGAVGVPTSGTNVITRYTDYGDKITAALATQARLVKIAQALEGYGRVRYAERMSYCNANPTDTDCTTTNPPDQRIHIPMGYGIVTGDSTGLYNSVVLTAAQTQNGGSGQPVYFSNVADPATRKTAMVNLMRLIGLPDEFCCSAVDYYTDSSGNLQPLPFYYFSNPRLRASSSTCGVRFNGTTATTLLPPRITNVYVPDGTTGATCG